MNFSYPDIPDPSLSDSEAPLADETNEATDATQQIDNNEEKPKITPLSIIANIISWISVPILMPVLGTYIIFHLSYLLIVGTRAIGLFTELAVGISTVLPVLAGYALKKMGVIKDIALNDPRERLIPYIITGVCYIGTGCLFIGYQAPMWCSMFYIGGGVAALINAIVNLRWKISAHMAGIGGVVALLIVVTLKGHPQQPMAYWIVGMIMAAGLIGTARLYLQRHTLGQVAAGFAVGFLCVLLPCLIF